ncbi:MAG TPA: GDP-mannose 4,6-dehydratase, partial [Gammaproteobacteria bacterium]
AKRDWGHAKDYVEVQWLMLQQDEPEDFVIATGSQYSVRDFVNMAAGELGINLRWQGDDVDEQGVVASIDNNAALINANVNVGDVIVKVDPRYFRPTEVETLLGDASKAREKLGWEPKIGFEQMVAEMVKEDLALAKRDELCKTEGFKTFKYHE